MVLEHAFERARLAVRAAELGARNLEALREYPWPGNLEELEQAVQRIGAIVSTPSTRKGPSCSASRTRPSDAGSIDSGSRSRRPIDDAPGGLGNVT